MEEFKTIFSRPLFTIIFRPEMLKFHPYSILTGDTMVGFVIFCVLMKIDFYIDKPLSAWDCNFQMNYIKTTLFHSYNPTPRCVTARGFY